MINQFSYLYVEDDPLSREIMQLMLTTLHGVMHLSLLEDSNNFMARIKALPVKPDVIMLDIHIRPHDGFEILRVIRLEPDYASSKVIALTASVMSQEIEQLRKQGFDGAIGKPLSVQTFPILLTRILEGQSVWHSA